MYHAIYRICHCNGTGIKISYDSDRKDPLIFIRDYVAERQKKSKKKTVCEEKIKILTLQTVLFKKSQTDLLIVS